MDDDKTANLLDTSFSMQSARVQDKPDRAVPTIKAEPVEAPVAVKMPKIPQSWQNALETWEMDQDMGEFFKEALGAAHDMAWSDDDGMDCCPDGTDGVEEVPRSLPMPPWVSPQPDTNQSGQSSKQWVSPLGKKMFRGSTFGICDAMDNHITELFGAHVPSPHHTGLVLIFFASPFCTASFWCT